MSSALRTLAAASSGDRTVHTANSDGKIDPASKYTENNKDKARDKSPPAERANLSMLDLSTDIFLSTHNLWQISESTSSFRRRSCYRDSTWFVKLASQAVIIVTTSTAEQATAQWRSQRAMSGQLRLSLAGSHHRLAQIELPWRVG